jgi:lipopolysaccharide export system protein LptC
VLSPRQLLLAAALASVGASAWWLQTEEEIKGNGVRETERRPDYTVDLLNVTTMDETGRPDRKLIARELRHYPDNGGNELEDPRLTLFKPGEPPWLIRSRQGHMSEDGDTLLLKGPVLMDREAGEQIRPMHIKTRDLTVRPNEDYARTERPVHVTSGADWLSSATGAEIWLGEGTRLKLFGRARKQLDLP